MIRIKNLNGPFCEFEIVEGGRVTGTIKVQALWLETTEGDGRDRFVKDRLDTAIDRFDHVPLGHWLSWFGFHVVEHHQPNRVDQVCRELSADEARMYRFIAGKRNVTIDDICDYRDPNTGEPLTTAKPSSVESMLRRLSQKLSKHNERISVRKNDESRRQTVTVLPRK